VLTPQTLVQDLDRRPNESPAPLTDLLVCAASTDLVVVSHIDIEHEFAALRLKRASGKRLAVTGLHVSIPVVR
jgi:hypothetical protein